MNIEFPTMDELAEQVAEKALDEFIYEGKTLRQWVDEIVQYEEEQIGELMEVLSEIKDIESISFSSYTEPLIAVKDVRKLIERHLKRASVEQTKDAQRQRDTEEFFTKYQEVKESE